MRLSAFALLATGLSATALLPAAAAAQAPMAHAPAAKPPAKSAAATPGNTTVPAMVHPGPYTLEPTHTRVLFALSHMGFTTWFGDFTGASGQLNLDPVKPTASTMTVTVPIDTVTTTNAKLDSELKSADWLDAAKYPTATFKLDRIAASGNFAKAYGQLTLHGVTKPTLFNVKLNGAGINPLDKNYTVGFEVRGRIKRSDYGVTKYVPLVGDDVDLIISVAFEQK